MKSSDFSPQFSEVWGANADSGTITYPIPATTSTSGRASLNAGFTTVNQTALAAGGIPPFGQDFNGIFKMLSTSSRNYESGNVPAWSSSFATSISGYPQYAVVQYNGIFYTSTADGNTTTPGASGATWKIGPVTSTSWTTVHGQTGYRICPDGEIEMWGVATVPASGNTYSQVSFSFPFTFPNMCYGVHATAMGLANSNGGWPSCASDQRTTTGARITAEVFGNTTYTFTNTVQIYWTARGY